MKRGAWFRTAGSYSPTPEDGPEEAEGEAGCFPWFGSPQASPARTPEPDDEEAALRRNAFRSQFFKRSGSVNDAIVDESRDSSTSSSCLPVSKSDKIRKWLSAPVRKLSYGRLDRASKKASLKLSSVSKSSGNTTEGMGAKASSPCHPSKSDDGEEEEESSHLKASSTPPSTSVTSQVDEQPGEPPPPQRLPSLCYVTATPPPLPPPPEKKVPDTLPICDNLQNPPDPTEDKSEENTKNQTQPPPASEPPSNQSNASPPEEPKDSELTEEQRKALEKRNFVLQELVLTEKDYVKNLGDIVEGYIEEIRGGDIPVPEDLKNGKDKIIFGNIEAIYEWHRDSFSAELEKCLNEPERLGRLFRRCERRLNMYVIYCQNKPKSEYLVSEYVDTYFEEVRQKLGHKLHLPDLLIKPVQRIMKYQLLLKDVLKYTEKAGLEEEAQILRKAVHIMHIVPKAADDMMNVGRLQGFDGKITAQGKLILQGQLLVGDPSSGGKLKERQVFLFEQIIIFSETVGQKTTHFSSPAYIYKNHIQVNKMTLEEQTDDGDPLKFMLKSKDPLMGGLAFVIQTPTLEERENWVSHIRAILDTQLDFLRALQSPIAYQKELTKDMSAPELGSLWNPSLRKTLSHPAAAHKAAKCGNPSTSKSMRHPARGPPKAQASTETPPSSSLLNPTEATTPERKHSLPTPQPQAGSPKTKRNFFEGFKNTLKPKSKQDSSNGTAAGLSVSHSLDSSTSSSPKTSSAVPSPGGGSWGPQQRAVILADYDAGEVEEGLSVSKGELVQILATDIFAQRCLVQNVSQIKGWIPWHAVGQDSTGSLGRKNRTFRLRKPSFSLIGRKLSHDDSLLPPTPFPSNNWIPSLPRITLGMADPPKFIEVFRNQLVKTGTTAYLCCRVDCTSGIRVVWGLPGGREVRARKVSGIKPSSEAPLATTLPEGTVVTAAWDSEGWIYLSLENCHPSDSGLYTCMVTTGAHTVTVSATLTVQDVLPSEQVQNWKSGFEEKYELLAEIGRGRCSTVFQCLERSGTVSSQPQILAAKFVRKKQVPPEVADRERAYLSQLDHPHLLRLVDAYHTFSDYVILTNWIKGVDVCTYLCQLKTYTECVVSHLFRQLLLALDYLHARSISHLNVKPDKCLVDDLGCLTLLDLGEARRADEGAISHPRGPFSPFNPPELFAAEPLGRFSDSWGAGMLLYLLLCGSTPPMEPPGPLTFPPNRPLSLESKGLARRMLAPRAGDRLLPRDALRASWLDPLHGKDESLYEALSAQPLVEYLENQQRKKQFPSQTS